jgi:hypothetical protein
MGFIDAMYGPLAYALTFRRKAFALWLLVQSGDSSTSAFVERLVIEHRVCESNVLHTKLA